jgi:N-acetyl-gamma-glutamyl-phosphate reductase
MQASCISIPLASWGLRVLGHRALPRPRRPPGSGGPPRRQRPLGRFHGPREDGHLRGGGCLAYVPHARALKAAQDCDAVLLATPRGLDGARAPAARPRVKVVDLSGAFRLADPAAYPSTTASSTGRPRFWSERSTVFLSWWTARPSPRHGWWPIPAAIRRRLRWRWCRCCAPGSSPRSPSSSTPASGVSGAGRQATEAYSFCEVADDVRPYKVLRHQHTPEIAQSLARGAGKPVRLTFTPHLLPIKRGILSTASARLAPGIAATAPAEALRAAYRDEPLVEVLDTPEQVSIARTVGTPRAAVSVSTADSPFDPAGWWWSPRSTTSSRAREPGGPEPESPAGAPRAHRARARPRSLSVNVQGFRFAGLHAGHQAGEEGPRPGGERRAGLGRGLLHHQPRPGRPGAGRRAPAPCDRRPGHPDQQRQRQRPHRRAGPQGRGARPPGARRRAAISPSPPSPPAPASSASHSLWRRSPRGCRGWSSRSARAASPRPRR